MEVLTRLWTSWAFAAWLCMMALTACKTERPLPAVVDVKASKATQALAPQPSAAAPVRPVDDGSSLASMPATELERRSVRWLEALRAGDVNELQRLTSFPFELREPAEYPSCQPQNVRSAESLREALACLLEDTVLREELGGELGGASASALGKAELPSWAASLAARQPRGARPVVAVVPGVGVNFEFVIFANEKGVSAVWKNAEYDPN